MLRVGRHAIGMVPLVQLLCCSMCQLYLLVCWTLLCICESVFVCVSVCLRIFVFDELYCVSAGWWRTTRPTWQRWPYCKNSQIHIPFTHKHTQSNMHTNWAFCRWFEWNSRLRCSIRKPVPVFVGETWKKRLHRRTWPRGFRGESAFIM